MLPSGRSHQVLLSIEILDDDLIVVTRRPIRTRRPSRYASRGNGLFWCCRKSLIDVAGAVPHGTIRSTTVKEIFAAGGSAILKPELTRGVILNLQHVNIVEGTVSTFSPPFPNPVSPKLRRQ
jgi:hypothetical protein